MAHQLSARMLRQLINEEVQLVRLRQTIRETIESMALDAASREDMDEGIGDFLKSKAKAAKTGLAIGGIAAGLGGMAGTDYVDRTFGHEAQISQALADNEVEYDAKDLINELKKLSPDQLEALKAAVKKQSGMGGAFTGSSPSVNDAAAADRGPHRAGQGGYRRNAVDRRKPPGTSWSRYSSNPAAYRQHSKNVDDFGIEDFALEMLEVMPMKEAMKLASSFAGKK